MGVKKSSLSERPQGSEFEDFKLTKRRFSEGSGHSGGFLCFLSSAIGRKEVRGQGDGESPLKDIYAPRDITPNG